MGAIVKAFLGEYWIPIAVAAVVAAGLGFVYLKGHSDGSAAREKAQLEATFKQLKERIAIDETVHDMSDDELCRAIGGQLRDGICQ